MQAQLQRRKRLSSAVIGQISGCIETLNKIDILDWNQSLLKKRLEYFLEKADEVRLESPPIGIPIGPLQLKRSPASAIDAD